MQFVRRIVFLFFFLSIQVHGYSQQYHFKTFLAKNGLASSNINHIIQDTKGYIWFATMENGISRYDGKSFKNFSKNDGLIGNEVTSLCEDKKGNIWIGTTSGISCYDSRKFTGYTEKNGLGHPFVYNIYCDSKGVLWVSTFGGGITIINDNKFSKLTVQDGLPTNEIFCVLEDHAGRHLIGTYNNGLCVYDGKNVKRLDPSGKTDFSDKSFFCLKEDSKNRIWAGTAGNGLWVLKNDKIIQPVDLSGFSNDFIGGIIEDQRKNIWAATEHGLLKIESNNQTHLFTNKEGLNVNTIQTLCEDYEGNLWIGTLSGGVSLFKNEAVVNFSTKDGLVNKNVQSIYSDSDGNYLIGTESTGTSSSGLTSYSKGNFKQVAIKELIGTSVVSIIEDSKGKIWAGTSDNGIIVLDKKGNGIYSLNKKITRLSGVKIKTVISILEDKEGAIWVGSYGSGVFRIKDGKETPFTTNEGLITDNVFGLSEDRDGNIWIGTFQEGVIKYDGHTFKRFTDKDGLADNTINSISEDDNGRLFFATASGLSCFGDGKFKTFDINDGLPSNLVNSVTARKNGYVWMGSDKGVIKLQIDENLNLLTVKTFGEQNGIKGSEVNSNCLVWDKNNRLWIGTTEGLSRYTPSQDFVSNVPQKIILSGVRLFHQKVDWSKYAPETPPNSEVPVNLQLSHKNYHLTFDFQALTTDNVRYTYILEGLDENWTPLSTTTEAVYSNIPSGHDYTFKVKALSSDGVWSKNVVEFNFRIKAPFWQTWWFYTLCLAVVVLSTVGYIRRRTYKLQESKRILEVQVKERTIEIQQKNIQLEVAFEDIKSSIEYAKRIQYAILPKVDEISKRLPDSFILYKPRDIVSGDFYWFAQADGRNKLKSSEIIIAAADCTGHGVPGAFMSIIGNTILNEIVNNIGITKPSEILNHLHVAIRQALKQETGETRDGMDIALIKLDLEKNVIEYSGAMRPLWIVNSNGELNETKADKQAIGGLESEDRKLFTNHEVKLEKGESVYISTDGFADQFGGPKGKKFMVKNFQKLLLETDVIPKKDQEKKMAAAFKDWKGDLTQLDDVLVIGIRV